ncbi:MAG: cell division protein ZapA [Rhodobacterales bacterium]|nr:MAG: cell division protein ZapA [Rhodobacterales bacterium]
MPDVTVTIGERSFDVACQEGEEHFLRSAAALLDAEAKTLVGQIRHLTEPKMLLLAGLMLADKTAGIDDELKLAEKRIAELEGRLAEAQTLAAQAAAAAEDAARPAEEMLAGLAARVETLAEEIEARAVG